MSNGEVALSLVLPAYNEALRLPPYLAAVRQYFTATWGAGLSAAGGRPPENASYEVIVVDDGSHDGMAEIVEAASADWPQLRCIRHPENRGKGAAVRTGVLASCGELVLFADADGATPIDQEARLRGAIRAGAELAIGSRLLAANDVRASRNQLRAWIGRAFAGVAAQLLRLPVRDTQCGFKMLRGDIARELFADVEESGYLFDLELLVRAQRRKLKIVEVPINWQEMAGAHCRLVWAMPQILRALWRLRRLKTSAAN